MDVREGGTWHGRSQSGTPLWGILLLPAYTLMGVLPFMALGWLCMGAIAAGLLRSRRPATFETLGRAPVSVDR